jgi:hypothetical protein
MKWWKYKTIYATGSSLTAGGGMNDINNKSEYKRLLNIDIDDEKDFTYPTYISKHFNCDLIHDAQSGSGAPRLIRRTYNYIRKVGIENAKKTLFLFEITDPVHRVDFYLDDIGDYVIVNVRYDNENDNIGNISSIQIQHTTTDEGIYYSDKDLEKYNEQVKLHLEKFHNPVIYTKKFIGEIAGLFAFLEKNNIDYFYQFDNDTLKESFDEFYKKIFKKELKINNYNSINQFAGFQNLTVKDDLQGFTDDLHPGYFGHKLFAEEAIKVIEERLKPKLYVFGDSHTQNFESHQEARSEWAVQYINHLGYCPKNYADLISEYYGIEVINNGKGGCSNYTIFDTFIDTYEKIEPKDIVIFGWTSEGRFRVACEVNSFVDVIPFNHHPAQNDDVPKKVTDIISYNKVNYNIWWKEISNFIKIAKDLLPNNKNILSWTWVDDSTVYPSRLWSQEMLEDKNLCIYFEDWKQADHNLKKVIIENSDLIVDFSKEVDLNNWFQSLQEGKRVTMINANNLSKEVVDFISEKNIRKKIYHHYDYKKLCYNLFIPYKKYVTINEETKGLVDDLHTSHLGHRQLTNDLIRNIRL